MIRYLVDVSFDELNPHRFDVFLDNNIIKIPLSHKQHIYEIVVASMVRFYLQEVLLVNDFEIQRMRVETSGLLPQGIYSAKRFNCPHFSETQHTDQYYKRYQQVHR